VTFRYRFFFHEGDEKQAQIEQQYAAYVKEVPLTAATKR
jgi:hypothetical protein